MHTLNSAYTTYFNIKRKRAGHLFQGRYKAFLIDANTYLLELSRYIHMNPVRSGYSKKPEEYPYSSYLPYIASNTQTIVHRDLLWGMVSKNSKKAPESYRLFVESALEKELESPLKEVYGGVLLGPKSFIMTVLSRAKNEILQKEDISRKNTLIHKTSDLEEIIDHLSLHFKVPKEKIITTFPFKAYAVYLAKKHTPLSNAEIGKFFGGLTFSAISKIGTRMNHQMEKNQGLKGLIISMEGRLSHVKV
jgi:putative transposase